MIKRRKGNNRQEQKRIAQMRPTEWMTMVEATVESKQSKPVVQYWVNEGLIESFILKARPDSRKGRRLIRRSSLLEFLDRQFKQQKTEPPKIWVPKRKKQEVPA
jgi:hypothetical protein